MVNVHGLPVTDSASHEWIAQVGSRTRDSQIGAMDAAAAWHPLDLERGSKCVLPSYFLTRHILVVANCTIWGGVMSARLHNPF